MKLEDFEKQCLRQRLQPTRIAKHFCLPPRGHRRYRLPKKSLTAATGRVWLGVMVEVCQIAGWLDVPDRWTPWLMPTIESLRAMALVTLAHGDFSSSGELLPWWAQEQARRAAAEVLKPLTSRGRAIPVGSSWRNTQRRGRRHLIAHRRRDLSPNRRGP